MSDRVTPPRLLLRLESEIANAKSPLEADCKRAERAAYLARVGRVEEAKSVADELQRRYEESPNAVVSSWRHLILGLVSHFDDMNLAARDRMLRAHALSSAANLNAIRALSAAWAAHMDYLHVNPSSMVSRVAEALRLTSEEDHSIRSRACLVVAQAYHFAGRLDAALPWYGRARSHASAEGDEATLSAIMHNMAWLRGQQLRIKGWMSSELPRDEGYALLGAESVGSFDEMIGSTSLSALIPVLRAQIHASKGQYPDALSLYEKNLDNAVGSGMKRLHADLIADQAWCRINTGQVQEALRDAAIAEMLIDPSGQFDDRAMAHGRLAQVFAAVGNGERATHHRFAAVDAFAGHAALQAAILLALGDNAKTRVD